MKSKVKSKTENTLTLVLEDTNPSFVNALRRAIIAEVPSMAVEDVTFLENTSPIYDEMISHRIGLLPIDADVEMFNIRSECKCKGKGCANCTVAFTLEKVGPSVVYSQDLKFEDPKIKPTRGIPLFKLGNGQKISLQGEAILGRGKEHAKWQPALASYKYYPEIEVGKECEDCRECAEVCPTDVYEFKSGKLKVVDLEACILCNACVETCEAGAIKVRGREDKFIFKVESAGALKPEYIFNKACDIMAEKADGLADLL